MADNLNAAAFAAGLSDAERARIEALNKTLNVHRELSNLPANVATQEFNSKTPAQKNALKGVTGETPESRGWLGTTWHYTGGKLLSGLQELSDVTTRAYRAVELANALEDAQPGNQYKGLSGLQAAWDAANDKGDKVFDVNRIEKARKRYGDAQVNVATRIAAGESLDKIVAEGTEEEKQVARIAYKGFKTDSLNASGFQEVLDAVNAAKYSPGRKVANAVLPEQLEGSGLFYKPISGTIDAAYRILADPTLILGKVKRAVDASRYALDVVIGQNKVDQVFANPNVVKFWDTYGAELNKLNQAKSAGNTVEAVAATNNLKRLAPEFGPAVVSSFLKAEVPVTNALTAKAFFENAKQTEEIFKGAIGRKRVLMPRLDAARQTRINIATTANKVFNLDRIGPKFVDNLFFGAAATDDGIAETIINGQKTIVESVKADAKTKGVARFSTAMVQKRIDSFKRRFENIPFFDGDVLDVTAKEAPTKIYQLARLTLPQRESKLIAQAFENAAVGRKKEIFYGLQGTILDIRGAGATKEAREVAMKAQGKTNAIYAARNSDGYNPSLLPDGESVGLIPSDFSNFVTTLSVKDIDRLTARSGLIQRMFGFAHSDWVDKMTGYWSFLTLAGPRYALRNATEDLLVHLAIGETPWGLASGRSLSTRLRTARQMEKGLTEFQKKAANPLGGVLRFVNKKEAAKYSKAIEEASGDIKQVRLITANALNEGKMARFYERTGIGKLTKEDRELLSEQILYGDLDNALADVVEGGRNAFTGVDQYTKTIAHTRKNRVRSAELTYDMGAGFRRAKGKKGFDEIKPDVINEASMIAWVMRIGYYANDNLGGIAIANLATTPEGERQAIIKIMDWMKNNPEIMNQARMEERNISQAEHAKRIYDAAKQLFVKRDGKTLNEDLLSKVRKFDEETGSYRISGELGLDDLPMNNADLPDYIVGPQLVSISDSGNYTASLMEWGWDWLGNANARLSREPMVLAEMIKLRKQFRSSGFEDAFIASFTKGSQVNKVDVIRSLNPNISTTDNVALVKSDFVKKFIEFDRTKPSGSLPASSKTIASIAEDLKSGKGFTNPLRFEYDVDEQGRLLLNLVEGNHRIQAALQAGIDDIPIQITSAKGGISNLKPVKGASKPGIKDIGFQTGNINPSDLLPESAFSKKTGEASVKKLTETAKAKLAEIVEDRARLQVLAYVDNPAVQSQFAFSIRNFARFYRATEDFYRRLYRGLRYNPESIRRAQLTYEGVTHSGWVQKDDQGEAYFVYPGTEHVYKVVQGVMTAFGVPAEFKVPMPVEFGAKIKMITPSLNPESMVPTFAGPVSGISIKVVANLLDFASPGASDVITQYGLGKYAVDQSFVSAFLPAHVNRIYQAMGKDERDGQYASAMRKAMTYLESAGYGLPEKFDADGNPIPPGQGELEKYRERLNNVTQSILGLRVIYGFTAPATPTVQLKSEMADWVRENGKANFKQVWYGLLDRTGDYDTAIKEWVRLFPDQIPFTVSESERSTVAYFRYAEESGKFVDKNEALFKQYPQAAAFLIPHKSGYSWNAYKTMTDMGLRKNKRVEDFLREVQTAADMQTYYAKKTEYETGLEAVGTDFERSQLRAEWRDWSTNFKQFRPLVQEELAQGGKKAIERQRALDDLQQMLNDKSARKADPKTFDVLKQMNDLYVSYKENYEALSQFSGTSILQDSEKEGTIIKMRELSQFNENTLSAYNVLYGRLLGD
jgi:hypothetical protein